MALFRHRGYTLIELLLVMAILGIILSVSTLTYRTIHANARLDRTALETQNFLEGAMAYNVDNSAWPAQNLDLATCSTDPTVITDTTNFLSKYIPNQTTLSQLGYYYCWGPGPITSGTASALFWVALKIPHGDLNMASQLAAKLPNGITTQDPTNNSNPACTAETDCYVRAMVATPSSQGSSTPASNGIYVAGFGECMGCFGYQ